MSLFQDEIIEVRFGQVYSGRDDCLCLHLLLRHHKS